MKYLIEDYKVTINLPSRKAEVNRMHTPNLFAHYSGTKDEMERIAFILNASMGRMDSNDRIIPIYPADEKTIKEISAQTMIKRERE